MRVGRKGRLVPEHPQGPPFPPRFGKALQSGLQPGETVDFHLENGDVRPVEYRIVADSDGAWRQFYVPFLWHRDGGTVLVDLDSASCSLNLAFDWSRRRP